MSSSSTTSSSSKAAPPSPSPTTTGAHSALQAKHQARVQKLEAQIQNLEARLLKKRKRIQRITDYVQPYDDDGKVPCTLVGVRRDRYEALLQLPCYKLGSELTYFEERSVEEAKACSEPTSPYTSDDEPSGSNFKL